MSANRSGGSRTSYGTWRLLYQGALFETDRTKIIHRIAEAEKAILVRIRELTFVNGDHIEEDVLLDDALYAVRALRNCVNQEEKVAQKH
jgi:hypothetical protein